MTFLLIMVQTQILLSLSETEFVSRTNIWVIKCILWTGTVHNLRHNIRGVAYLLSIAVTRKPTLREYSPLPPIKIQLKLHAIATFQMCKLKGHSRFILNVDWRSFCHSLQC